MKILFIAPPLPKANSYAQPIGFAYMGSILRNEGFNNIRILDACSLNLSIKKTIQIACEYEPDIVGITVMTVTVNNGLEIACGLKTLLPNVKIVFGGVHASVVPEDLLNNYFVDIVVRNEGEYTFLEVVQRIGSGEDLEDIKGTSLNIKGELLNNPNRSRIIDLDSLPFPSRDLLPLNAYKESYKPVLGFPPHIRQRTLMFSGRGCPFDCHYCAASTVWGSHRWVTRSANNILDEIESVVDEFGIFGFEFVDELTTLPKERLFDFCEGIHKRRLNKIRWICSSTVKQLDYDTAMIMRKAGCSMVLMGVESGSSKIRKALNKRISNEEILYAFESARKAGLDTCACIMLGAPGENFDTWQQTINLTKKLKPGKIALNIVTPYPGTCIYNNYVDKKKDLNWDNAYSSDPYCPDKANVFYNVSELSDKEIQICWWKFRREVELNPRNLFNFKINFMRITNPRSISQLFINFRAAINILLNRES